MISCFDGGSSRVRDCVPAVRLLAQRCFRVVIAEKRTKFGSERSDWVEGLKKMYERKCRQTVPSVGELLVRVPVKSASVRPDHRDLRERTEAFS
jgi:hypothetical protein